MAPETDTNNWQPITPHLPIEQASGSPSEQLRNWSLVLASRNIPFRLDHKKRPTEIHVPSEQFAVACHEIRLFQKENVKTKQKEPVNIKSANNILQSLSVLFILGIFHNLTYFQISGFGHPSIDWLQLGSADSLKILSGEWWRIITALTLHADGPHLLGNILIGGYFVARLCQLTGSGLGWILILASGAIGNLANTLAHGAGHNAVGASTAIFGAIGIAGALNSVLARHRTARFWLLPLAAAGILLAFLGTGNGNSKTDVGAHLFGFLIGIGLGIPAGVYLTKRGRPNRTGNKVLSILGIIVVIGSWLAALRWS
jgi:membrane associated rhomboid family serine protease